MTTVTAEAEERRRKAYRMEQWSGLLDREGLAGVVAERDREAAQLEREHREELRVKGNWGRWFGYYLAFGTSAAAVGDHAPELILIGLVVLACDVVLCWLVRHIRWVRSE